MIQIVNLSYLAASIAAVFASCKTTKRIGRQWLLIALGVVVLGGARATESGLLVSSYLHDALMRTSWYDQRRSIQIICITVAAIGLFFLFRRYMIQMNAKLVISSLAFCLLLLFCAFRLSSLHWSDMALAIRIASVDISYIVQLTLVGTIFTAAIAEAASLGRPRT